MLQMAGLESSMATDNSLIVALEPLMTVILACLLLGRGLRELISGIRVALVGFALLTGINPQFVSQGLSPHHLGNLLMLLSLLGEAYILRWAENSFCVILQPQFLARRS